MSEKVVVLQVPEAELPAPLVPADVDLRGYEFMPFFGNRLISSFFDAHASDAEFRAGVNLWWSCWLQSPAASLPDDDVILAKAAGFGRDLAGWQAVRNMALHGFVKCQDGRLYHRMLAEEAMNAWKLRQQHGEKKARHAAKMAEWRRRKGEAPDGDDHVSSTNERVIELQDHKDRCDRHSDGHVTSKTGQDRRRDTSVSSLRSDTVPPASPPEPPPAITTTDPRTRLFREGLSIAMGLLRKPEHATRALIGKWLKAAKDDAEAVHEVITDAAIENPAEPVSWITAALKARVQPSTGMPRAGATEAAQADCDLGPGWRAHTARKRPWFATLAKRDRDREGIERWCYGGAIADLAENRILEAAGLPHSWQGDLGPAVQWLSEGWSLGVVCRVIGEIAGRGGYQPPRTLQFFDKAVRAERKRDEKF